MSFLPELSVVVGTYNRLESLKRCLSSIIEQTRTPVIAYVTDAGSIDGTQEYLQRVACPQIVPFFVGRKLGQAKSYNDIFRHVQTQYVAWLSDDNEVVNNGLDIAVDILRRRSEIGMVGLKVKDVQGPFASEAYIGGVSEIGVLNVNQGVLRTNVLRNVGYLSELFGSYGIDPDLTARVLYAGNDVVYTKLVALNHYRSWPIDEGSPAYAVLQQRHRMALDLYRRKYAGFGADDKVWTAKRRLWRKIRRIFGDPRSTVPKFGGIFRDWENAFLSRHINPVDPWLSIRRDFHLRQHVHRRHLPTELPRDPVATQ